MEKVVAKLVAAGITPNELQELIYPEFLEICTTLQNKEYGFDVLVPMILITKSMMGKHDDFQECLLASLYSAGIK